MTDHLVMGLHYQRFIEQLAKTSAYQIGNQSQYCPEEVFFNPTSPLAGKRIGFLGSSVTYGVAAMGNSFVEYLQARDGIWVQKSAVSGSTMAGSEKNGYLTRLQNDFQAKEYDLMVCQLSTNDNRYGKVMGRVTANEQRSGFNTNTTLGAIEAICAIIKERWDCSLVFFTCLQTDPDEQYQLLIDQLKLLQVKWGFEIIDLFNNQAFQTSLRVRPNAMVDSIHPTQLGYLKVWLPLFEEELKQILV